MFLGLDIISLSRHGPVFLLVYITIRNIVKYSVLDIFFRPKLDPVFFIFLFKTSYSPPPPPPIIKIKWSFPYAGDSLCNRSVSRTKHMHAVWISSQVDILLLCNIKAVFEIQC